MSLTAAVRASERDPVLQMVKTAVATILAWVLCELIIPDGPPPIFAAIAAMLVVQPSINQSLRKGVERSAGVLAGVLLATGLATVFGSHVWVVLSAVSAALALAWALRLTTGSANQIAISALLVLTLGGSRPDYAFFRVVETGIGAVIGVVVHLVLVAPVALEPARSALERLGEGTAAALDRLAEALTRKQVRSARALLLHEVRDLHSLRDEATDALDAAEDSLDLNPRARRYRGDLVAMRNTLEMLTRVGTQTRGMTRAFVDHYDDGVREEPVVAGIAEELRRAAHDTRLHLRLAIADPGRDAVDETEPALTAPIDVAAPRELRWILIGSLMEDLRRIRHELGAGNDVVGDAGAGDEGSSVAAEGSNSMT